MAAVARGLRAYHPTNIRSGTEKDRFFVPIRDGINFGYRPVATERGAGSCQRFLVRTPYDKDRMEIRSISDGLTGSSTCYAVVVQNTPADTSLKVLSRTTCRLERRRLRYRPIDR